MDIIELLEFTVKNNSSDLHLSAGLSPMIRVDGDLRKIDVPMLNHKEVLKNIYEIMTDGQREQYEARLEIDFSFEVKNLARFRVNAFNQSRGAGAAFRAIPSKIFTLDDLHLPPIFTQIASLTQGLVLVTGPTGSGKSTTLAALINYINGTRYDHIITIEDPIEFIHFSQNCLINQREVYRDTYSFGAALRSALREDPDIILVGELRDLETIRLAMTAAETGHLVFATLHTNSAPKTIDRIIDVFSGNEKSMVRSILAESLQAVVAQQLLKKVGGGRIAALEIMLCNPAIRHLIREDKIAQMYSVMQTGKAQGMMTLEQHLKQLVSENLILPQTLGELTNNKGLF